MKQLTKLFVFFVLVLMLSGCGEETGIFNNALDADRVAREKMKSALNLMAESLALEEADDETVRSQAEGKKTSAVEAFNMALEGWETAEATYTELMQTNPDNLDYVNNLANMLYYKAYCGLDSDLDRAKAMLKSILEKSHRPIFERNLQLINDLKNDSETVEMLEENHKLVELLKQ